MVRRRPRARAGFSRLAASPVPADPPAPIRVCASSMNRMIGLGEDSTSSMTWRRRFSNSPFTEAPACSRPMSSERRVTFCSEGGTSPSAIRRAKPSTTAVLPTPASPVRIGLFCRRRSRMSTTWRISASRPTIWSISPFRAFSVRSTEYLARASDPPGAPAAEGASPAWAPVSSDSVTAPSVEAEVMASNSSPSFSTWTLRHSGEIEVSAFFSVVVFSMPKIRCPVRTRLAENISEA